ncbi:hypothetical protein VTO42DRAFT_4587 [Malbranchea cinnamomea]
MPAPSRSLSLREPRTGQRTGQAGQDVLPDSGDQTEIAKQPASIAMTSTSSAPSGPRNTLPRTKSISTRSSTVNSTDNSDTGVTKSASRRSLLPQPRGQGAEKVSASLEKQKEEQTQQQRDILAQERRRSLRLKSVALPAEAAKASSITPAATPQTPKSNITRLAQPKVPAATRLGRSASLQQPSTPRPVPASGHVRHRSQVISADVSRLITKVPGTQTPSPLRSPVKTTFSTPRQAHNSRKQSQPPTPTTAPTSLANYDSPSGSPLPSYVASLQTELLQLQLLHSQALQARAKWEKRNEERFRELHDSAAASYRAIMASERATQRRLNVGAINQWRGDTKDNKSRYNFQEQIQILSRVLQDVTDLTDPQNGGYTSTIRRFERWFEHAMTVRQSRGAFEKDTCHEELDPSDMEFIDPLDDDWKENVEMLSVKVELCARELDCLDVRLDPPEGDDCEYHKSALVRIVKGHRELLALMLDELRTVVHLEAEILEWERAWVKNAVDTLGQEDSKDSLKYCPAWERA